MITVELEVVEQELLEMVEMRTDLVFRIQVALVLVVEEMVLMDLT